MQKYRKISHQEKKLVKLCYKTTLNIHQTRTFVKFKGNERAEEIVTTWVSHYTYPEVSGKKI
ncbi:hypothetical protein DRQ09_10675 [candidate division KSB1 bacterium]|nr:MAG: hypothetical protein DRQ09_10675 [candidate division KSB1 bacterium]